MTPSELLATLSEQNIQLWAEGSQLRYRAPKGALTLALRTMLAERREDVLLLLRQQGYESISSYPLSYSQRGLWFLHQTAPESAAYNVAFAARIRSEIDVPALRYAFQALVDRHPTLRTTYTMSDSTAVQRVHSHAELHFEEVDASAWRLEEVHERIAKAYRRPFDLERGPLARVSLFTRSAQDHVLLLTVHHIAVDGWSLLLLLDELRMLYSAQQTGLAAALPSPKTEYTDYVRWQTEMLDGPEGERLWAYWQKQLAGEVPVLNFATDRPRPPVQSYNGTSHVFTLNEELTRGLGALARAEGATLYMLLLAAFQGLLHRYTGQEDILVGSPTYGRSRPEFAGIVGDFINMVVLRANLSGKPTFKVFLGQIRSTVLGAIEHQDYPFFQLVARLQPIRDPSRSPLFQTLFALQKFDRTKAALADFMIASDPTAQIDFGGLKLEPYEFPQQEGQFDLGLEMAEGSGSLFGVLKYNSDLFDAATIDRMADHFQTLLEGIVANPEQPVSALPLLTKAERHQLLVEWNDTKRDYRKEKCLHELIEEQAERTPDAIAVVFEDRQLAYRELNARANQLAHYLRKLGVGPEAMVGICIERSLEMVVGLLGILKAGGAYVPLDPGYPKERLAFMLQDAQVPVLLTQAHLVEGLPEHGARVLCLDRDWEMLTGESTENPASEVNPENLAYVIYTSGSTGQPKGAMNTHKGICNRLLWMQEAYKLTEADRVLQKTPFSFDVSVWEFFWPLLTGARLVVARPGGHQDSAYLVKLITGEKITTVHFVPSMLQVFLEESGVEACQSLKRVICSGEALSVGLQQNFFARLGAELHNLYGPTEAAVDVTFWACERESSRQTVPIGRPIANTQIHILDSHCQPVPIGAPGELCIGGVAVGRGYLNRPELTAEKFVRDPFSSDPGARLYRTGDLARYLPEGTIEYLGRIDHQVKIRGFRIELEEIESTLSQHPSVREAVVMALEDVPSDPSTPLGTGKRLVGYVVFADGSPPTTQDLREFLQKRLPEYMIPSQFVSLESLPLTPNGKVDRGALPLPSHERADKDSNHVPPGETVDFQLVQIWEELLAVRPIGMRDNFFDLGGHSLLAVQMMHRVEQVCGEKIPLSTLLGGPTIENLAKALVKQRLEKAPSLMVEVQAGRTKRPVFLLHSDYSGGGFWCLNLARGLGEDQPFYALTPHGLDGSRIPPTVEAMAADYLSMVRKVQPNGPYILGGVCGGGVIVFEMAQQLRQQGEKVDLLILVGPAAWNPPHLRYLQALIGGVGSLLGFGAEQKNNLFLRLRGAWIRFHETYRYALCCLKEVKSLRIREQMIGALRSAIKRAMDAAKRIALRGRKEENSGSDAASSNQQVELIENHGIFFRAMNSYVRRPYPGRVVIVWPANEQVKIAGEPVTTLENVRDRTLGWSQVVSDLEFHEAPGWYVTLFTKDIRILATLMKTCLDKIPTKTGHVSENEDGNFRPIRYARER